MAVTRPTDSVRNGQCDALVGQLNNGFLRYSDTPGGAVIAECTFGNPAFGAAVSGVATANPIGADTSAAGDPVNDVTSADLVSSGGVIIARCDVSTVAAGTGDIQMSSVRVQPGDEVDTQSLTYATAP